MSEPPLIPAFCFYCGHEFLLRGGKPSKKQTYRCLKCNTDLLNSPIPELDELFSQCADEVTWRYALMKRLPEETSLTVYQLWEEVRRSFILGQYGAALSLSSGFLQHMLEKAIGNDYEAKSLGQAINHAKGKGLIDKKTQKSLDQFRSLVRNRYAHGDHRAISGNFPLVEKATLSGETSSDSDALSEEIFEVLMKERSDITCARRVLQYIYKVTYDLIKKAPGLRRGNSGDTNIMIIKDYSIEE